MKKVAIVQSNYIPWKGYFDMIAAVDEFMRNYDKLHVYIDSTGKIYDCTMN